MENRASGWRRGAALVIGGLVGPYISFARPATLDVLISALALALPVLLSVLLDRTLAHNFAALVRVGVPVLVVGALVIAGVRFSGIWQAYANDAGYFSLLVLTLLAPLATAFALGAGSGSGSLPSPVPAIGYGALAWVGVGIHDIAIPYGGPLAQSLVALVQAHSQAQRDSAAISMGLVGLISLIFVSVFLAGFGVAVLGGWGGGALRARMSRVRAAAA